jgi:cell division protein FtsL
MIFLFAAALVQGLGLVWVNIERVDLAYEIKKLQTQIDNAQSLISKLQVERDNLVNPRRLDQLAKDYGLGPAKPGQIRRFTDDGKEVAAIALPGQNPADQQKARQEGKEADRKKAEAKEAKKAEAREAKKAEAKEKKKQPAGAPGGTDKPAQPYQPAQ